MTGSEFPLPDVDWSRLRHNYGEATDVPALLERLVSDGDPDFEIAQYFCHQGHVGTATREIVPFLLAVVRSGAPSTVSVLQLLEAILHAEGGPLEAANALANVRLRRPGTGEWVDFTRPDAAELDIERRWVREMKRAILSESLLFASCLADTSPDVRAAALGVLAAGFAGLLQEMPTLEPEIRQAPIDAAARMKLERILAAGTG